MSLNKVPMTQEGADKLRVELNQLKSVERRQIIEAIAEARAHGDLKENAEYHAAKERQSFIEGRIKDLEGKLQHCNIIDVTKFENNGKVIFGATVTLLNLENEAETKYQIVGVDEADLKHSKISVGSPMARGVIGKGEGDVVVINTPSGNAEYEIVEVEYL